ncbi:MAG: hypothetical protein EBX37_16285, partial [Alphaproteobacteria bacterium]|nr:hypothetical protein [Alphaproteobacteria bacterium]
MAAKPPESATRVASMRSEPQGAAGQRRAQRHGEEQMHHRGRAGPALGMAALGSFIAGTLGIVVLTFFS